jgi:hypothetical protein
MTYRIEGHAVSLELIPEEIDEVIRALALCTPESELLQALQD